MGLCELENDRKSPGKPTNEYVLNFAFFSFIGFVMFQAVFALIAKSESMLADSEAMSVDALTYLFNLVAERIKNAPYSEKELSMSSEVREYQRELRRLYLELIPPAISVTTLIVVTMMTLRDAIATLRLDQEDGTAEDVSVPIMLIFSGANLLLDVVNVTCFARVGSAFGLEIVRRDSIAIQESIRTRDWGPDLYGITERSRLLSSGTQDSLPDTDNDADSQRINEYTEFSNGAMVNLNMCSAWTVSCTLALYELTICLKFT
jgi:hypothetical protein